MKCCHCKRGFSLAIQNKQIELIFNLSFLESVWILIAWRATYLFFVNITLIDQNHIAKQFIVFLSWKKKNCPPESKKMQQEIFNRESPVKSVINEGIMDSSQYLTESYLQFSVLNGLSIFISEVVT